MPTPGSAAIAAASTKSTAAPKSQAHSPQGGFLGHVDAIVEEHKRLQGILQELSDQNSHLLGRLRQYEMVTRQDNASGATAVPSVTLFADSETAVPVSRGVVDRERSNPRMSSTVLDATSGDCSPVILQRSWTLNGQSNGKLGEGESSEQVEVNEGEEETAAQASRGVTEEGAAAGSRLVSRAESRPDTAGKKASGGNILSIAHTVSMELIEESDRLPPGREVYRTRSSMRRAFVSLMQTTHFDLFIGMLIVANTVTMSLQLQYDGLVLQEEQKLNHCAGGGCNVKQDSLDTMFELSEQFFTAAFVLELVLRLGATGPGYLLHWTNAADASIVVISAVDAWVLTPLGNENLPNINILRLLRLLRLSKVLRVVRVMKAFKALRVLVSAVASSVGALGWSMTLLFVLELMAALFLSQLLQPYIQEHDRSLESKEYLYKHFGTWWRAMLSTFEITMAPGGFLQYRRLYEEVHWFFALFLVCYVCLVTFAVVRVITAMFLKATLSASEREEAAHADNMNLQKRAYGERLQQEFQRKEHDQCMINHTELLQFLEMDGTKKWLEEINLEASEAERLFRALDRGNGTVLFMEFINAMLSMSGTPRACDLILTLHEVGRILEEVLQLETVVGGSRPLPMRRLSHSSVSVPAPTAHMDVGAAGYTVGAMVA